MNLYKINLPELMELYSVANTPNFIFNKFRANSSIRALSSTNSSDALIKNLDEILNLNKLQLQDATLAYAILTALSLNKDWPNFRNKLVEQPLNKLRWAEYLLQLSDIKNVITTTINPYKPQISSSNKFKGSNATNSKVTLMADNKL